MLPNNYTGLKTAGSDIEAFGYNSDFNVSVDAFCMNGAVSCVESIDLLVNGTIRRQWKDPQQLEQEMNEYRRNRGIDLSESIWEGYNEQYNKVSNFVNFDRGLIRHTDTEQNKL